MSEILHPKVQRLFFNKANIARPRSICLLSVVSCCSKIMAEYCGYLFWEFWYNVNDTVPTANFTLKKRFTLLLLLLVLSNCPPLTAPDFQFPWTGWNVRERLLYLVALQAWKAKEDLKKIVKDLSRCFAWVGEKKLPSNTHTHADATCLHSLYCNLLFHASGTKVYNHCAIQAASESIKSCLNLFSYQTTEAVC